MKGFKKFYIWAFNAKLFMGIYFVALVFLVSLVLVLTGKYEIELLSLFQMLILSMLIAILQCLILDDKTDYARGIFFMRSVIWVLICVLITVGASFVFGWFAGLPSWCPFALGGVMLLGFTAMLIGFKFEQDLDTKGLNEDLDRYKKNLNG
ncbi:MAG: hypothetical protein VB120_08020 [Lachnospiraceae bacterium]|nr:hypothetical protein [Lachnospiraceae bacterium]